MAVTAGGTPYVESSDLVANYPGVSLSLANHIDTLTGKIIQVIEGSTTTNVSISTTTMTDTGLTATITPTSATSKILVLLTQAAVNKQAVGTQSATKIRLMRDATQIALVSDFVGYTNTASVLTVGNVSSSILDAPATTSALTYKTQFAGNDTTQVAVQVGSSRSSIILVEVAA